MVVFLGFALICLMNMPGSKSVARGAKPSGPVKSAIAPQKPKPAPDEKRVVGEAPSVNP